MPVPTAYQELLYFALLSYQDYIEVASDQMLCTVDARLSDQ